MLILAIDPGTRQSGYVAYSKTERRHATGGVCDNADLLAMIRNCGNGERAGEWVVVIERVVNYGKAVGDETFDTILWAGRFAERAISCGARVVLIPRKDVKLCLCGTSTTKDTHVREALANRLGATKKTLTGSKNKPGPLYGLDSHAIAAYALAVTYCEGNYDNAEIA